MKKIALLTLLLTSCASNYHPPTAPTQPTRIASGTIDNVMWVCSEEEVNNSLVWVKCDFARTNTFPTLNTCVAVSYYTDSMPEDWIYVYVANKKICSGELTNSKHESTKYVAFTGKERKQLNDFCGNNLTKCTLTARALH